MVTDETAKDEAMAGVYAPKQQVPIPNRAQRRQIEKKMKREMKKRRAAVLKNGTRGVATEK